MVTWLLNALARAFLYLRVLLNLETTAAKPLSLLLRVSWLRSARFSMLKWVRYCSRDRSFLLFEVYVDNYVWTQF